MDERRIEELLRERGERLAARPLLSARRERELLGRLESEARGGGARRRPALRLLAAGLAAAAVLLLWLRPWAASPRDFGRAACEVALLDAAGRRVDVGSSAVRGAPGSEPDPLGEVLVEVVAAPGTHVRLVGYDTAGERRAGPDLTVGAAGELLERVALAPREGLAIAVVASRRAIPDGALDAAFPARLPGGAHLAALAAEAERSLGATVTVRSLGGGGGAR